LGSRTFGVAKRVSLFSVRVFPCTGSTSVSNVIAGVDWVTQHAIHPAVANMSVEAGLSTAMNDAVNASIASGIPYVVAAGNEADDACSHSPSSIPNAIVVGGTDSSDQRLSYSNFGPCLDLFAPGGGVPTIWNTTNTMTGALSGTSVASPIVAGVVALYLQSHPLASPLEVQVYLRGHGTTGVIADAGVGSLNLLLYSPATGSGDPCQGNAYLTRPSCASTASD
jgi:subtilisin family serine protease